MHLYAGNRNSSLNEKGTPERDFAGLNFFCSFVRKYPGDMAVIPMADCRIVKKKVREKIFKREHDYDHHFNHNPIKKNPLPSLSHVPAPRPSALPPCSTHVPTPAPSRYRNKAQPPVSRRRPPIITSWFFLVRAGKISLPVSSELTAQIGSFLFFFVQFKRPGSSLLRYEPDGKRGPEDPGTI